MTTIEVRGIVARGRHGVAPDERGSPQEFDVDVDVDVEPPGDDLSMTTDYREIAGCARTVVEEQSFQLLETLANELVDAIARLEGVRGVRVTVHKPGAAKSMGVRDVAVRAER